MDCGQSCPYEASEYAPIDQLWMVRTDRYVCVVGYWEFLDNSLGRYVGFSKMPDHLVGSGLIWSIRCCELHSMIFCMIPANSLDVRSDLTILKLRA